MTQDQLYEQLYLDGGGRIRPYFREDLAAIVPIKPEIQLRTDRKTKGGKALPDGIEVRFGTAKPTDEERKRLIAYGFRWSAKQKMWYAIATDLAKELLPTLRDGIMADDDPGVVKHFWKRLTNIKELDKLTNYTQFMWGGRFFRTKKQLYRNLNSAEIKKAIKNGELRWKKFYTVKSEDVDAENGDAETGAKTTKATEDEDETLRLRAQALALKLKLQNQEKDV